MHSLFLLLFRLSCIILILGLIRPHFVLFWTIVKTRTRVLVVYVPLTLILFGIVCLTSPKQTGQTEPSGTAQPGNGAALKIVSLDSLMPHDEEQFIDTMNKYMSRYRGAATVTERTTLWQERDKEIDLTKSKVNKLVDWVGKIKEVGATPEGLVAVVITIENIITLKTASNAFSDAQDHTLVTKDEKFYKNLPGLTPGTPVRFSATLLKNANASEADAMMSPTYLAKFTNIEPVK